MLKKKGKKKRRSGCDRELSETRSEKNLGFEII
jgi:hypothetical protein